MEFVDSPEYVARQTTRGATFQVRIRALPPLDLTTTTSHRPHTPNPATQPTAPLTRASKPPTADACRVLVLPYAVLERCYGRMAHMRGVMECVVAKDVTHKLFATGEAVRGVQKLSVTIDEQRVEAEATQQREEWQWQQQQRLEADKDIDEKRKDAG